MYKKASEFGRRGWQPKRKKTNKDLSQELDEKRADALMNKAEKGNASAQSARSMPASL